MDLLAIGFVVGGVVVGGVAWLLASARAGMRTGAAVARADAMVAQARSADTRAIALETELRAVDSQRAAEAARAEALARNLEEQRALLDAAEARLGNTFQALAAESLRANQEGFLALATERFGAVRQETAMDIEARQKAIEGVVAPMRVSLEKFDEHVRIMERDRGTAYGALKEKLDAVTAGQERLRDVTGNLVGALKATSVRGRWGEMQLRRVVELAGMVENCDFEVQTTVTRQDGEGRLRPDMVVRLPGGKTIVVDAKTPLEAYLEAQEAPTAETRAAKLRQHAMQVRTHVGKLAAKSYCEGFASTPELVVMFLPGEWIYSMAHEQMPGLIEDGYAKGVLIATPTTLLGLLHMMSLGWREERLAENAQLIADEGRKLHERIATVFEHFGDLGRSLNHSVKHFNQALASINRRVLVSARHLEGLDARGRKPIAEVEEIDRRAATAETPDGGKPGRRIPQQPLLTLAPAPTGQDT